MSQIELPPPVSRSVEPAPTPIARLLNGGSGPSVSDVDLLAVVLGPGSGTGSAARRAAERVLEHGWPPLAPKDQQAPWWAAVRPVQGVRLAAALELARRIGEDAWCADAALRTPQDVYDLTADLRFCRRERFQGLYLNTRHRLLVRETISVGSLNASIVHPREVFAPALDCRAASVVVVHNHPSGETDPSEDDLAITRRLDEAGRILGIHLLDHVIVGRHGFTSLKEAGHLG